MRTQQTGLRLLLATIFFALTAHTTRAAQQGGFSYEDNGASITITGYTGGDGAVIIPATIDGLPVTSIGVGAFIRRPGLGSVTIPNSVTSIDEFAFSGCTSLTSVTIPNSVTSIGVGAFAGCTSLSAITVEAANSFYSSVDGILFDKSQTTLNQYPGGKAGSYTIPNSVTSIVNWAFEGCTGLTNVTIPDSVTSIGDAAFGNCANLANVTIGNSVISIGYAAFYNCASLTSLTIPNSVTSIGDWVFGNCTGLTSVTIPNSVTGIGVGAFAGCTSLASITIPNSVSTIGRWAFSDCTSLASVTIGNGVTSIGRSAFFGCTSLASITIPNSVTSIGEEALFGCTSLGAITVQPLNSFYSSIDGVLFNKSQTTLIQYPQAKAGGYTIPNSVTIIEDGAFLRCTSLTSVTIPNSVTSIEEYAFSGCASLTSVTIANSVTSIGRSAFSGCTSLTNVTIPNSVTSIGRSGFSGCTSLASVTIGNSVASIGEYAFTGCDSLSTITVDALNTFYSSVEGVLFDQSLATLIQYPGGKGGIYTIPNSVTSIGRSAFSGCTSLTNVTIGNSVASIGEYAFYGCDSLTAVYFEGNRPNAGSSALAYANEAIVHYLPGTTGWEETFAGRPTVLWNPQAQTSDATFGVRAGQFGFTITWASGLVVVVEACADLEHPVWTALETLTLTGGSSYFSDPDWAKSPSRIYRLRSP